MKSVVEVITIACEGASLCEGYKADTVPRKDQRELRLLRSTRYPSSGAAWCRNQNKSSTAKEKN